MLWHCCVGPHRLAHLSCLPSSISPSLPAAGSFLGTATAQKEVRSTAPPPASHGGLSSGEDGLRDRRNGKPTLDPWPIYLPGPPSQWAAHSTCCSQAGLRLPWAHGGSGGRTPTSSAVLVQESWPGLSLGEGPRTPPVSPEELSGPSQQGPDEKLRLRED